MVVKRSKIETLNKSSIFTILILIGLACIAIIAKLSIEVWEAYQAAVKKADRSALEHAIATSARIDSDISDVETLARSMATELERGNWDMKEIEERLTILINSNAYLYQAGVAIVPFGYDPHVWLNGIILSLGEDSVKTEDLGSLYDYTKPGVEWYHKPLAEEKALWIEPKRDRRSEKILATYAVPFFTSSDGVWVPKGVLFVSYDVEKLADIMYSSDLGEMAYCYLVSQNGRYLAHPSLDYLESLHIEKHHYKQQSLNTVTDLHTKHNTVTTIAFYDDILEREARSKIATIPATEWKLGVVYAPDYSQETTQKLRRQLTIVGWLVGLFCFVASVGLELSRKRQCQDVRLRHAAVLFSVMCILATIYTLTLVSLLPTDHSRGNIKIKNEAALNNFLSKHRRESMELREAFPFYVPTGIYIQSCTFIEANKIRVTGYIWQKYYAGIHSNLSRGFTMPQSESDDIELLYHQKGSDMERLIWRFSVVLNKEFDYSRYPFGREDIWIELWHKEFAKNVVLVPDIPSYKLIASSLLPGLSKEMGITGWIIEQSYFSYKSHTYETNFGQEDYSGLTNVPELYFNITIRKRVIGPLVSHLLPIMMVLLLLFIILMLSTRTRKIVKVVGFNTMSVVTVCAGFFLVVIFSHIDLRDTLAIKYFSYMEYFYFLVYLAILLLALNALLFNQTHIRIFTYKENFFPKLFYWPVNTGVIFLFTAVSFY